MKRKWLAIMLLAAASVGLSWLHPFGNPRLAPRNGPETLLRANAISPAARRVLLTKCADCHSNETRWPVYARLTPGSWLIERDIMQARAKMNLSHWEEMSSDAQDVMAAKMIHETRNGAMPPLQYRLLHWDARLTADDLAALGSVSRNAPEGDPASAPGDPQRGRTVFERRCTGCHAIEGDREGPHLAGVFGRRAASVPGFAYSAGLTRSGITWNESTLERWLADPDSIAPDTTMDFHVPKAQERADLIAYLRK